MKAGFTAAVALAAMAGGVSAARHRHMHDALFKRAPDSTSQECTTGCYVRREVITGEPTLVPRDNPVQEAPVPATPTPDAAAEAAAAAAAQQKQQEEQKQQEQEQKQREQEQKQKQQEEQKQKQAQEQKQQTTFPAAKEAEQGSDNGIGIGGISLNVDVSANADVTIKDGGLESSNDHFGVTYTPWRAKGQCKSEDEIDKDIAGMKAAGYTTVRTYQVVNGNCKIAEWVGKACVKHGLKLIVGIWLDAGKCNINDPDVKGQLDALVGMKPAWGVNNFDVISLVVVGNEAVWGKKCSAGELAAVLEGTKNRLKGGGYEGKYTVSETIDVWENKADSGFTAALCPHVDFVGANIHAYFNPNTAPGQAGDFVSGQLSIADKVCPGKKGTNLECGWPTAGDTKGAAVPGVAQQAEAIKSIRKAIGSRTVFFSPFDDVWKDDTTGCNCEKHWGMQADTGIHIQVSL